MRPTLRRRALLALPLGLATPFVHPAAACTVAAAVPLRLIDGYPTVPATILGQAVTFIVDTGAQGMLLVPEVAAALGLPLRGIAPVSGTGGSGQARLVALPDLRLGGTPVPGLVAPVTPLPVSLATPFPLAGLLGASLLARFDVLIDVPGGSMVLSLPGSCPPPPGRTLPIGLSRAAEAFVDVSLNGTPTLAMLDTGSRATLVNAPFARSLGLGAAVSASTARGIDGRRITMEQVQASLAVGGGPAATVGLQVTDLQLDRGDMLLGLDQLGRRPFWIGYSSASLVLL